ncbi:zinc ABC transporter substrate-binding protein [Tumebacillus algifaecis]|uniref:Zinc ABC transporter substrate-binding protein n=1 Tax=Tumebacillus algifaecis TaxID=1214604 RepID=A0A223D4M3_9BACL|nr:metal ABC transporter substrate-binding protein [Tumebacillus algifaecis]ASS76569.1 zinc ABC transporter substrate-binding protein [Tumebacillus algifaecis]
MNKWWKLTASSLVAASLILTGCAEKPNSGPGNSSTSDKIKVVTSFYPMYEFTKKVAGDLADVTVLVPAGTEPHDWEPTAKDVARISEADIFVYNGAGFESWVDSVLGTVGNKNLKVVEASHGADLMEGVEEEGHEGHKDGDHAHDHDHGNFDPHIWLDPVLAQHEVQEISAMLQKADPAHQAEYQKNTEAYLKELKALDQSFQDGLKQVKSKEFVTSHTAFAYLAHRYGLKQVPIAGISPEQEPSASEMKDIVAFAKSHNVNTIFFETLVSPKVAEAVAKEVGAVTAVLNPLEGLTEEEKKSGLDYIGVMKQNLEALTKALTK